MICCDYIQHTIKTSSDIHTIHISRCITARNKKRLSFNIQDESAFPGNIAICCNSLHSCSQKWQFETLYKSKSYIMGKSSINGGFSIAMITRRVSLETLRSNYTRACRKKIVSVLSCASLFFCSHSIFRDTEQPPMQTHNLYYTHIQIYVYIFTHRNTYLIIYTYI